MRNLTRQQQNYIKSIVENSGFTIMSVDNLETEECEMLERMNNYENLWSDANRYINDLQMERIYR